LVLADLAVVRLAAWVHSSDRAGQSAAVLLNSDPLVRGLHSANKFSLKMLPTSLQGLKNRDLSL